MHEISDDQLKRYKELEKNLQYTFQDIHLLENALTHRSFRKRKNKSYERLEFLGDRVLGMVIADELYHLYPNEREGDLSKRLTALVRKESCEKITRKLGIHEFTKLSPSEEEAGGANNPAIMADICESVIAAIYLDGGFEAAKQYVILHWKELLRTLDSPPLDPKSALQEWLQKQNKDLPEYELVETYGPEHDKKFVIEVRVDGLPKMQGKGKSKKIAEQKAAEQLLEHVKSL